MATFTFTPTVTLAISGNRKVMFGTITSSGAFTAGGDTLDPGIFGMSRVSFVAANTRANSPIRTMVFFPPSAADGTAAKVRAFINSSGAEYTGSAVQNADVAVIGYG